MDEGTGNVHEWISDYLPCLLQAQNVSVIKFPDRRVSSSFSSPGRTSQH